MSLSRRRGARRAGVLVLALAVSFGFGTAVVRAHGGDPQLIHACVTNATGEVIILADPTPYGSPRANCPRPTVQHALDWNQKGIQGPPGPAGGTDSTSFRVYEYERPGKVGLNGSAEKHVAALALPPNGTYAVGAKVTAEGRKQLVVRCYLSMLSSGASYDDVATANTSVLSNEVPLDYPTQTLYLQEIYRIPPEAGLRIVRVRCKGFNSLAAVELTNISIQAMRFPYAAK
jgi:hypothetical protein